MPSRPPDEDENKLKEFRIELGKRLSDARHAAGLTRRQVSELTGVAQGSIYMTEGGGQNVGIEILWRLAKALGITLGELFGSTPGEPVTRATLLRLANVLDQMTTHYREQVKRQAAYREYLARVDEAMVKRHAEFREYLAGVEEAVVKLHAEFREYLAGVEEAMVKRQATHREYLAGVEEAMVKRQVTHREYLVGVEEAMVNYLRVLEEAHSYLLSSLGGVDDEG
jgi:transcriptional regulator with XRE-family HTH domain